MADYKISQTPGASPSSSKKPVKKGKSRPAPKRPKSKVPKLRQTQSLNTQYILGGIVGVAVLILAGVGWVRFINKPTPKTGDSSASSTKPAAAKGSGISSNTFNTVTNGIGNQQPDALNKYFAKTVCIVIPRQNVKKCVPARDVQGMIGDLLRGAQTPWNWHISPQDLSNWQTGPDGQYFTGNVIVGESNDGTVVSIHVDDNGNIDIVFIAPEGDVNPTGGSGNTSGNTGNGGNTGNNGGSGTTTPPDNGTTNNSGNDSD